MLLLFKFHLPLELAAKEKSCERRQVTILCITKMDRSP